MPYGEKTGGKKIEKTEKTIEQTSLSPLTKIVNQ